MCCTHLPQMLPSRETVRQVIQAAKAFWAQHPDDHIAIHCAYGFNRTGVQCNFSSAAASALVSSCVARHAAAFMLLV